MEKERRPKPRIPGKLSEGPPAKSNEEWMDKEAVRSSEENALGSDSHKAPTIPCYTMMGPRDDGPLESAPRL
jgi:hypothetical protein